MTSGPSERAVLLPACRELLESHPDSVRIRTQVEALEAAMPESPGIAVSFCRTIIETTCKTILTDRGGTFEAAWEAPKLVSEALKYLDVGRSQDGTVDSAVKKGAQQLVRGLNQIVQGVVEIRNVHGLAAHGDDAYAPLLDASYAEILARATDAVVGLLFRTHLNTLRPDTLVRFRYRDHPDFDDFIDAEYGPFEILDVLVLASEALYRTDFEAYRAALVQFRQDQEGMSDQQSTERQEPSDQSIRVEQDSAEGGV